MLHVSPEAARWLRMQRQGLVEPWATPERAATALAGVQAQIMPAAGLALWNRTVGLRYADFDARLHDQRTLVRIWAQRGTLHVVASPDWPLVYAALAGTPTYWERQALKRGVDRAEYRQTVARIAALLHARETLGRSDLRSTDLPIHDGMLSAWGGIFHDLVRAGLACHARQQNGEGRFAHRERWLPTLRWDPPAPAQAEVALARRYLAAYGPATVQDLAFWRGTTVRAASRTLVALQPELAEVQLDGRVQLAMRQDLETLAAPPPPREAWPLRLLYRFDPLLLAHRNKHWVVDPAHYAQVWRPAGHIEGVVLEHGRAAGTWRYTRRNRTLLITVTLFAPLPAALRASLEQAAAGVAAFFGLSPLLEIS